MRSFIQKKAGATYFSKSSVTANIRKHNLESAPTCANPLLRPQIPNRIFLRPIKNCSPVLPSKRAKPIYIPHAKLIINYSNVPINNI